MATNHITHQGITITWLNHHAAFAIILKDGRRVVIDPWEIPHEHHKTADIILLTHPHYDHFSPNDIRHLRSADTLVVGPPECHEEIKGNFKAAHPGTSVTHDGIIIETVPAYNTTKFKEPGQPFHPHTKRWNGYVIDIDGVLIYHAGDTDVIDEMHQLKNIAVALLPCGGTYTMDAKEAAHAANIIKPQIAIPMHWGKIVGTEKDAETFKEHFKGQTHVLS